MKYVEPQPYKISLTAMFCALSLITLYLAAIVPVGRIPLYFISSLFVSGLLVEGKPGLAALLYLITSGLGALIVPGVISVLPYVLLFGHYGIGKYFFEKIDNRVVSYVCKLLYWNVCLALIYFLAFDVLIQGTFANMALWLLIALGQVAFVAFDYIYSKTMLFYARVIRRRLMRQ